MQIPLARRIEPERNRDYEEEFVNAWDRYTLKVRRVLEWAKNNVAEDKALKLAELVHASWDAARQVQRITDREVRWWQWMTACWYYNAVGRHIDDPGGAPIGKLPKEGNVIDARELIERLRARNLERQR